MFSFPRSTAPRFRSGSVVFLLLLTLFLAAPARAAGPVPTRTAVTATAPAPLGAWYHGLRGLTNSRTGIIQICVLVAAIALLILIKRLN
jgi:hypothetical protein